MGKYPYNMGSAVIYSIVLLSTLWWIPIVGPIIIGYITGRKAGGPLKGLIAMAIPIALYFMAVQAINEGLINVPPIVKTYFGGTLLTSAAALPFIQYIHASTRVAMNVGTYIEHYIYYAPPSFFIMLSFAFIGGAVSRQIILERGIYKEVVRPKKKIKPFKMEEETNVEEQEPTTHAPRKRAPREYIPNPVPDNHYPSPQPIYGYSPQPMHPQMQPQMQNYPSYQPYGYPQYAQYPQYPQYPPTQEGYSYEYPVQQPVRRQRKTTKRRRKKVEPFQDERESKFVVHEMDTPKNVESLLKKKSVNRGHSIAFL